MPQAVGMIEVSSISQAIETQDEMLKAADVELLVARTICSGKYIVMVGGDVDSVQASLDAGRAKAEGWLIDDMLVPNVHPTIFPALANTVDLPEHEIKALGIVETFSATSIVECADAAAKASDIILFRVHVAMAIGGKGFLMMTGEVSAVEVAVQAAAEVASEHGILVGMNVIPNPRRELFREYI